MNTFEATHAKPDTHVVLYEDYGVVAGHRNDQFNVSWISISWQDGTRTELPVDDAEDLELVRGLVYFEPTEYSEGDPAVTPERGSRH
jgi:hypothetical protein